MTPKAGHTFTAGPWEVVPLSGCGGPYAIRMAYMSDNPRASKTYYGVQGVGTEANARLIAAAPELLNALKLCIKELRAVRHGSVGGVPNDIALLIPERIDVAEAAIAKAEGGAA